MQKWHFGKQVLWAVIYLRMGIWLESYLGCIYFKATYQLALGLPFSPHARWWNRAPWRFYWYPRSMHGSDFSQFMQLEERANPNGANITLYWAHHMQRLYHCQSYLSFLLEVPTAWTGHSGRFFLWKLPKCRFSLSSPISSIEGKIVLILYRYTAHTWATILIFI